MKRLFILLAVALLSGAMLVSCNPSESGSLESGSPPPLDEDGYFQITVNRPPFQDKGQMVPCKIIENFDSWNDFIKNRYGFSIKIHLIPAMNASGILTASYYPQAVADGDISGLIELNYDDYANIPVLKDRGLILPLDEYLRDNGAYQNLPDSMKDAFVFADGKTWALSAATPTGIYSRKLRKEWLSELGLALPADPDELYAVAKAFAYDDPNGNGIADEHGMDVYYNRTPEGLKDIFIAYDCYLSNFGRSSIAYDYSTKSYEDAMLKPEMKKALEYIKGMLDEKILWSNTVWSYSDSNSDTNGDYYSESATTVSEDNDIWAQVYTLSDPDKRSVLVRGPEKCLVMTADTPDPEKTINAFVDAFYSDLDGMLAGVYGEENINYTLKGNEIINSWEGDQQEKFSKNILLVQKNYSLLYEKGITLSESFLEGKVGNIEVLNRYFANNTTIIDLLMPLHSDYRKVQTNFTEALNEFINNTDSINVDDFIDNYIKKAEAAGFQDILNDLNLERGSLAQYSYR